MATQVRRTKLGWRPREELQILLLRSQSHLKEAERSLDAGDLEHALMSIHGVQWCATRAEQEIEAAGRAAKEA